MERQDYFWQLDADVAFRPGQVDRMIELGVDVVSGMYPQKDPDKILPTIHAVPKGEADERGLIQCTGLPGGFLFIKADVLLTMCRMYKSLLFTTFDELDSYAFWSGIVAPWPGRKGKFLYHGEDFAFTHRLHKAGFKLYADLKTSIAHCFDEIMLEFAWGDTPAQFKEPS